MRLAHRLVLGSSAVVALVMTVYGVTILRQRERLIGDALVRETETLAHAMQIVASSALRNGQTAPLDRTLGRILRDPDTAIGAVLDPSGRLIAGGPAAALDCLRARVPDAAPVPTSGESEDAQPIGENVLHLDRVPWDPLTPKDRRPEPALPSHPRS